MFETVKCKSVIIVDFEKYRINNFGKNVKTHRKLLFNSAPKRRINVPRVVLSKLEHENYGVRKLIYLEKFRHR